ncbi:MAG: tetratricopeptide repeat protein [Hyphomonadaceae bacterium]
MLARAGALASALLLAACATGAPQQQTGYGDFLIARVANMRADHSAAADRYFAALARAPHDDALITGALASTLASGDLHRARQAARLAPREGGPGYAYLVRAADALTMQRWRTAAAELNRVEGPASEELLSRLLVVWARAAQGDVDQVMVDLAPLAAIRPYGGLFAYQQAMALDYAGRNEEALAAYALAAQGGIWLPAAIERHADLLVRTGDRDTAIAVLEQPANQPNPALVAALARVRAGGAAAAERLTPARGAAVGMYGLSAIFLQEGDSANGLAALSLALMLDPNYDGARLAFAQQQASLGHTDIAREILAEVSPDSPYSGSARIMEAWALLDAGREDEALALARANAAGGDLRALRTLADMHRSRADYAEAEAIYTQLIGERSDDWRLYFARGAARERLGRWPEAEADLRHALELSPDQPDVLNYLGYTWIDRGERLTEGLAMIERAVELRPMSGAVIDSLGWAHYRLGDYARALDLLERAVELEPADATLNDHLGDVYWRLNRRIEARFQWRRALSLSPDNAAAIEAKIENGLPPIAPTQSATR